MDNAKFFAFQTKLEMKVEYAFPDVLGISKFLLEMYVNVNQDMKDTMEIAYLFVVQTK